MSGGDIYQAVCTEDDPSAHIARLNDAWLVLLISELSYAKSGVPALILGMAEWEAAKRWVRDNEDRAGAMGEGNV